MLRLSTQDKRVIDAFALQQSGSSRLLKTDGRSLYKLGMGGEKVAVWRGPKIAVVSSESTKSDETIIRYLIKRAGKGIVTFEYARKEHDLSLRFETFGDAGPNGQWDGVILAYVPWEKAPVGKLSWAHWKGYTDGKGNYTVNFVEVSPQYRRSGIATALYQKLFKDQRITKRDLRPSLRTEDGDAFRSRARLAAEVARRYLLR